METIKTLFIVMLITLAFLAVVTVAVCAESQEDTDQDGAKVQIEQLLSQIQEALVIVQNTADLESLPKLDSVTLNLSTELVKAGRFGVNLLIVSLGTDISEEAVQAITLKLKPPKPVSEEEAPGSEKIMEISKPLANAILSAIRGAELAKTTEPVLELAELEASIKFVVDTEVGGGVEDIKFILLPITADIKAEVSKSTTQEIIVSFKVED